jgi:hypothetical protein
MASRRRPSRTSRAPSSSAAPRSRRSARRSSSSTAGSAACRACTRSPRPIRDGELSILWLLNEKPWNDEAEDDQEPEVAGRCVKAPRIWHDVTGHHFAIWIRKHFWDEFGAELRRAVVLHELLHIEVKRDKDNQPKFATRKHDVEDFVDVARQYGPNALAGDGGRYVRAAALFAGEPEPMVGARSPSKAPRGSAQAAARPASADDASASSCARARTTSRATLPPARCTGGTDLCRRSSASVPTCRSPTTPSPRRSSCSGSAGPARATPASSSPRRCTASAGRSSSSTRSAPGGA